MKNSALNNLGVDQGSGDQASDCGGIIAHVRADWLPLFLFVLIALFALPIIEHTTSSGIGLRDDSFSYFSGAENLLAGRGYGRFSQIDGFKPITNFPPVYSILVAGPQLVGFEARAGARLIAGVSFAALILISGFFIYWATQSKITAVLAQGLILFSPTLLEVNSWAHSEGPYLAIMAGALWLIACLIQKPNPDWPLAVGTSIILALAVLTRYAGVVLLGLCALSILLFTPWNWRSKLRLGIGIPSTASVPLLAFLLRNAVVGNNPTNRPAPYWHPPELGNLIAGARTLLSTFLPSAFVTRWTPTALTAGMGLVLLLLLCLMGFVLKNKMDNKSWQKSYLALGMLSLNITVYSLFTLLSLYFLDRLIPLNNRILAPTIYSVVMLIIVFVNRVASTANDRTDWILIPLGVILLMGQISRGWPQIQHLSENGMGFSSPVYRSARVFDTLRNLPDRPIYSNNVPALYFLANREASFIPAQYDPASDQSREDYLLELNDMRAKLQETEGYLILIGWPPENRVEPGHLADLTAGLNLIAETRDGLIYCKCEDLAN